MGRRREKSWRRPTIAPIWQAPMARVSSPALAAAVSKSGGLGGLGLAGMKTNCIPDKVREFKERGGGALNLSVPCHISAPRDYDQEAAWLLSLLPEFLSAGVQPPAALTYNFYSFMGSMSMFREVLAAGPAVVSFLYGLPPAPKIAALRASGAKLAATVTCLEEAELARRAGVQILIAQGWEAGGPRGLFNPEGVDQKLSTLHVLRRVLPLGLPVVAAGGMMTAREVRKTLAAGASSVQLGTALLNTPEAETEPYHRDALQLGETVMTRAITGRPARCLKNRFTELSERGVPPYPVAYAAARALHRGALERDDPGYGDYWAGTGAARATALPARLIMRSLLK